MVVLGIVCHLPEKSPVVVNANKYCLGASKSRLLLTDYTLACIT